MLSESTALSHNITVFFLSRTATTICRPSGEIVGAPPSMSREKNSVSSGGKIDARTEELGGADCVKRPASSHAKKISKTAQAPHATFADFHHARTGATNAAAAGSVIH